MANPQIENGHLDLALEIVEKLCSYRISGEEYQVLWVIWRKTYGWHKKEDMISLSQFYNLTGMKKPSIIRAQNKLIEKNIVSKKANGSCNIWLFIKDFNKWKPLAKKLTVSNKANGVSNKANKSLAKKLHTNNNYTKETITKENILSPIGDEGIFDFNDYINKTLKDKRRHIQIIGKYFLEKNMTFPTEKSICQEIKRWLKPASILAEHTDDRIDLSCNHVKREYPKIWNLGTMAKYINDPIIDQ